MTFPKQPNKALELLAHLVPSEVLVRARELAQQIERDEYARKYIEKRAILVTLAGTLVGSISFFAILILLNKTFKVFGPFVVWLKFSLLGFALVLWLGLTMAFILFVDFSLKRAALKAFSNERTLKQEN